ncbi:redoxin family protein [Actinoplanes sp. NPDC051470]|uniref:redoxin family protein n=1 Tax=unclassified Actinoplanes TaxID=2626549 RepID=UPI00342E4D07
MGLAEDTAVHRLAPGDTVAAFALPGTDGHPVAVDPHARAATVVVFTSNACPYALAWHDRIQDVARDYAGRDVLVVQVVSNADEAQPGDSLEAMRARVSAGELAGPFVKDAGQEVARCFGVTATPEVFVADRAGVVRYHGAPDGDFDNPGQAAGWLRAALDTVLAGGEVEQPATPPAGCSLKWRVDVLWWDGCPSHDRAVSLLEDTLQAMGRTEVAVRKVPVQTSGEAAERGFPGSPSFQVGGLDLFPGGGPPALTCRIYRQPNGRVAPLPSSEQLKQRLTQTLARPWDLPGWTDFRKGTSS